jgi:heme/copper-type cytochrome/quinol oxidase subunit 1
MNYVMMFLGLFILILIPEDADVTSFALQSLLGFWVFGIGAINLLTAENNA